MSKKPKDSFADVMECLEGLTFKDVLEVLETATGIIKNEYTEKAGEPCSLDDIFVNDICQESGHDPATCDACSGIPDFMVEQ